MEKTGGHRPPLQRTAEAVYREIVERGPRKLADLMQALLAFLGRNDMMAYLVMMAIRPVEFHRVLKPTGSIYVHCSPTRNETLPEWVDGRLSWYRCI